jgi:hypothetical protein
MVKMRAVIAVLFILSAMSESSGSVPDVVMNQKKKAVVTMYVSGHDKEKSITAQTHLSLATDDRKPKTAQPQTAVPSDWTFFSTSVDEDAALFYSPKTVHRSGNIVELMVKWTYLKKQGPAYANSQKIIKLELGAYNYKLSYGIGSFKFDCGGRTGTETKEVYYDSEGNIIAVYVPAKPVSSYFTPDTIYGNLMEIVCTKQTYHNP